MNKKGNKGVKNGEMMESLIRQSESGSEVWFEFYAIPSVSSVLGGSFSVSEEIRFLDLTCVSEFQIPCLAEWVSCLLHEIIIVPLSTAVLVL